LFFLYIADTKSYLNASDDESIEFGTRKFGIKNYPSDYEEEWYLIVSGGCQVQITFEAFELEQSESCKNAYVEIREADFDDGPFRDDIEGGYGVILAERICGSSLPKQIRSAGNMVWVKFNSGKNSATNYKGFKASFKAGMQYSVITRLTFLHFVHFVPDPNRYLATPATLSFAFSHVAQIGPVLVFNLPLSPRKCFMSNQSLQCLPNTHLRRLNNRMFSFYLSSWSIKQTNSWTML